MLNSVNRVVQHFQKCSGSTLSYNKDIVQRLPHASNSKLQTAVSHFIRQVHGATLKRRKHTSKDGSSKIVSMDMLYHGVAWRDFGFLQQPDSIFSSQSINAMLCDNYVISHRQQDGIVIIDICSESTGRKTIKCSEDRDVHIFVGDKAIESPYSKPLKEASIVDLYKYLLIVARLSVCRSRVSAKCSLIFSPTKEASNCQMCNNLLICRKTVERSKWRKQGKEEFHNALEKCGNTSSQV